MKPARVVNTPRIRNVCCAGFRQIDRQLSGMTPIIKERIKEQFERRAEAYDADISYHPSLALRLLNLCQAQPGQKVLDLACGTGLFALSAAAAVAPDGHVIGVDISPAMLQQAQAKAAAADLSTVTQFICGDIEELQDSLPDDLLGTFDLAGCSAAIPFLTQPHKTLEAWRHWLKPGARLVMNAFVPPALQGHEIFQQVAREQYGLKGVFDPSAALGSRELVTAALEAAGYTNIQVHEEVKERWIPAATPNDYGERLFQIATTNNPFMSLEELEAQLGGADKLAAFKADFLAALVESLSGSNCFDAEGQRVLTSPTVMNVVATA